MTTLNIHTIVGARPQFIKAAALSRAISLDDRFKEKIINTDQHYDLEMSKIFFDELSIPRPHYSLGINGGPHGEMTGRMLINIEEIFLNDRPDAVIIYGDTNSTLAGALAAGKMHIPIIHIEAGLRSFNRQMPEEINRVLSDHISELLLCPTQTSLDNLANEGITNGVHLVGDVMHDATLYAMSQASMNSNIMKSLNLENQKVILFTMHRPSNNGNKSRLIEILSMVKSYAQGRPVIFPVHPRTKMALKDINFNFPNLYKINPLGYFDLHKVLDESELVFTDSGGLQKEAYFHKTPCITLREETEWVETIDAGWNKLWKMDEWNTPRCNIPDYGDGKAAEKCLDIISKHF